VCKKAEHGTGKGKKTLPLMAVQVFAFIRVNSLKTTDVQKFPKSNQQDAPVISNYLFL